MAFIGPGVAVAWCNMSPAAGTTPRGSYGISSLTDLGLSYFRFNFSSSLSDNDYSVVATSGNAGTQEGLGVNVYSNQSGYSDAAVNAAMNTSYVQLGVFYDNARGGFTENDNYLICMAVFH